MARGGWYIDFGGGSKHAPFHAKDLQLDETDKLFKEATHIDRSARQKIHQQAAAENTEVAAEIAGSLEVHITFWICRCIHLEIKCHKCSALAGRG